MNENEIERIAAAANALRPDWPLASLRTLLSKPEIANRPRRDVAVALAWVACESTTKTPARVLEAGPWWQAVADPDAGSSWRANQADWCRTCNYPKEACRRLAKQLDDPHEYVRNGDVIAGRVAPEPRAEMPDGLRRALRARPESTEEPA